MSKVTQQGGGRVRPRPKGESFPCPSVPEPVLHGCHPSPPGLRDWLSSNLGRAMRSQSCLPLTQGGSQIPQTFPAAPPPLTSPRDGRAHCA